MSGLADGLLPMMARTLSAGATFARDNCWQLLAQAELANAEGDQLQSNFSYTVS